MKIGTITRRINSVLDDLNAEFCNMYTVNDFEKKYEKLKSVGQNSNRPSVLKELYSMFEACGIAFEKGKDNKYYGELIKKLTDDFSMTPLDLPNKILRELYKRYQVYPSPKEYMTRIVNRLEKPEDNWKENSLRLRILKQFIKYGNYLSDAGFKGRKYIQDYAKAKTNKKINTEVILAQIDDKIFDVLETADKAQKKPRGKYGTIKLADDLANGKFRVGGATKHALYLFAMAYNMTYSPDKNSDTFNPSTDIEKNLFQDYYSNNLIRFITDVYRGKAREFESDPSGQGINYKNFAEIICLYFIIGNYTPQEKIKLASEMISRVQNHKTEEKSNHTAQFQTKFFRSRLIDWNILSLSISKFEAFIRENYDCTTSADNYAIGIMQTASEQNTAFENYKKILSGIKNHGTDLKNCNYGLYFADVSALDEEIVSKILAKSSEQNKNHIGEFLELLRGLHRFLGDFFISSPKDVTRTTLITAYYYYYNCLHEDDDYKNFVEFFKSFKVGIDFFLEQSGYQPLSGKNIFDLAVVFSSYAYING